MAVDCTQFAKRHFNLKSSEIVNGINYVIENNFHQIYFITKYLLYGEKTAP